MRATYSIGGRILDKAETLPELERSPRLERLMRQPGVRVTTWKYVLFWRRDVVETAARCFRRIPPGARSINYGAATR